MDVAPTTEGLDRRGLLGRFPPATEQAYREWGIQQALPMVRAIGWISVGVWAISPLLIPELVDRDLPLGGLLISWALNLPLLVIALVIAERRPHIWYAGVVLTVLTLDSLPIIIWLDLTNTPTIMLSMSVFYLYLAPVMQFPFRMAALVVAVVVPVTATWALALADHDGTRDGSLNFQLWMLGASTGFILLVTLVLENGLRRRYADEQNLARQQELLASSRALIRRYAPPAVADRLEHGDNTVDAAQRRRVTVFFADVVGFTMLADRIDPEALAEIVNDYLGAVSEIVERHGGTLNEFAGDGVMAIFGAPDEQEPAEQVRSALAAAQELQQSLPEWSRRWYPLGIDQDLQARIGINTGVVSIGTFGSAVRATYTGIGLQTNIAARIQAQCPPGSVLLSKTSWHLISDAVPCQPRGEVEVKGVHFPIAMYEPEASR